MAEIIEKSPPFSLEAEQAVLASLLVDRGAFGLVGDAVEPKHFYRASHGLVFQAMKKLYDAGAPVDLITVRDELGDRLDEAGGYGYLVDLCASIPTTAHAEFHAKIIRGKATLRSLIAACATISSEAFGQGASPEEVHNRALSLLGGIDSGDVGHDDDMEDLLTGYMNRLETRGEKAGGTHLESPWCDIDHLWTGARGELVFLAARPAMGKTAWALNYAWHVAQTEWVDFWSLEMDRDRLIDRLVVMIEGIDPSRLKYGNLDENEWKAVARAKGRIANSKLRIHKPKSLSAAGVRRHALKAAARGRAPALVVIDYLQLMEHPKSDRHDLALGATSRALKLLAGEAKCEVMALAQLSRAGSKEVDKPRRPVLTDLRDSGSLEQDADAVIFLHREAYYDTTKEQEGPCEVIFAKHRSGAIGTVILQFEPRRQRFTVPQFSPNPDFDDKQDRWYAA